LPEKYGYQTLPIFEPQTIFKKYINDKDGMNLWMQNTISTDYPNNTYITDDGSRFLIK